MRVHTYSGRTTIPGAFILSLLLAAFVSLPFDAMGQNKAQGPVEVRDVRYWSKLESVRVVIDLSRPVEFSQGKLSNPERLFLDLKNARIGKGVITNAPVQESFVKGIRTGYFAPTTVRIVLDLDLKEYDFKTLSLDDPPRIVVDVLRKKAKEPDKQQQDNQQEQPEGTKTEARPLDRDGASSAGTSGPAVPGRLSEKDTPEKHTDAVARDHSAVKDVQETRRPSRLLTKRVVIDAGHGGEDPGAVGPRGLFEKDVVLDIARRVRDTIAKDYPGYEVILTRDKDVFIPLPRRAAIANRAGADLFVSIHANASPRREARGIETYLLNYSTDGEAMRVAARENAISLKKMQQVQNELGLILASLERESKRDESVKLASHLQSSLVASISAEYPKAYNLGVKQALFYVLVDAKMPSALVEVSFVSNYEEERLLADPVYRQKIAQSIARGIHNYLSAAPPVGMTAQDSRPDTSGYSLTKVKYTKR